jgi:hypothetical protein
MDFFQGFNSLIELSCMYRILHSSFLLIGLDCMVLDFQLTDV